MGWVLQNHHPPRTGSHKHPKAGIYYTLKQNTTQRAIRRSFVPVCACVWGLELVCACWYLWRPTRGAILTALRRRGGWPLVLDKCGDEFAAPWLGLACLHCTASFEAVRAALASPPSPSTHTHAISCPCMTSAGVSPARSFNDPYSLYGPQHPRMHRLYLSTNVYCPTPAIGDFSSRAMQMPRLAFCLNATSFYHLTYFPHSSYHFWLQPCLFYSPTPLFINALLR